jgi:hypothetical protein
MNVPWEYMCDDGRFLSVSERTPIVRYLDLKKAHKPLPVEGPLKIVGMVSSPTDVVELDVATEKQRLEAALEGPIRRGEVEVVWLENATLSALHDALEADDFHVFHYIGHGAYDEQAGDGVLILEDDRGRGRPVTGSYLGQLMADEQTLQLAVLNACEGARTGSQDPFAGVAASLVKSEIPSVIAMQFEITDDAAILFAGGFYSALARGAPVDAALAAARKAIWANYNDIEWGTPVLFMRVPDGKIFEVAEGPKVEDGEDRPARVDLALALAAEPDVVDAGREVVWTLTIDNTGEAALSQVSALGPDGSVWLEPRDLAPGQSVDCNWRSRPGSDVEQVVTVSAVDPVGNKVTEQATGRVMVRPVERPVEPEPDPEVPWWKRPRYVAALAALVLLALVGAIFALTRGGDDNGGGGGGGGDGGESAYANAVLTDDPILYWRLDEEDGEAAGDASDNRGDGRYEGSYSLGESSDIADGTAVGFDESAYVHGPNLDLAGPFTVELWAKRTGGDGRQYNLFSQGVGKSNRGFHLAFVIPEDDEVAPDYHFKCDFYNNPFRTNEAYPDTDWHLWACTYDPDSDTRRLYRDGRQVSASIVANAAPGEYEGEGDVFLGVTPWNGPGFIGAIDEVAVYPRVLSRDRLLAHYEARR